MKVPPQRWINLTDWESYWSWPTERALRWKFENPNSVFRNCFKKIDGRVIVDHVKFWGIINGEDTE